MKRRNFLISAAASLGALALPWKAKAQAPSHVTGVDLASGSDTTALSTGGTPITLWAGGYQVGVMEGGFARQTTRPTNKPDILYADQILITDLGRVIEQAQPNGFTLYRIDHPWCKRSTGWRITSWKSGVPKGENILLTDVTFKEVPRVSVSWEFTHASFVRSGGTGYIIPDKS